MPKLSMGNGLPPPTVEERVQLIMRLIRRMKWRVGYTDRNIAAHWGVSVATIRSYSSEAFRRVKAEVTDPDATAATVCVALEKVVREGSQKGLAGHRSVIEASKTWANIAGATAPTRIEIGALANMTDEQLQRRKAEIVARLQEDDRIAGEPTEADIKLRDEARRALEVRVKGALAQESAREGGQSADQDALRALQAAEDQDAEHDQRRGMYYAVHGRDPRLAIRRPGNSS